ncbi:transcriptional regulator [Kushneria sinocarnis]|uniref:Transcriptional regulator n=1 Tax=Kushneria sinocarnis TaxID=595502 RepID=A0A420X1Q5_9GAMM|nr:sugar-binding domain-containing protein [Kushneria sinocarnis]RKR07690.1 transcriptional regulator [Kushneria sinocarnis]
MTGDQETGLLAASVAQRFYIDNDSKIQIAENLGISRFKVARLLDIARERGMVEFVIRPPIEIHSALSSEVRRRFGLREAVVVESFVEEDDSVRTRQQIGRAAAALLGDLITEHDVLGVGWGRTTSAMVDQLERLPGCPVVQICGIVGTPGENSLDMIRRITEVNHGKAYPMYVPLIVSDDGIADSLRREQSVAAAMAQFDNVSAAAISIGSIQPLQSQLTQRLEPDEQQQITASGAVAEILGTFIRSDGSLYTDFSRRTLAMGFEEMRRIANLMILASGSYKADAVRAAFTAGLGNILVTDRRLAERLLAN